MNDLNFGNSDPLTEAMMNERTPSAETLPPWKRCAQNGWAPHSFYLTEPVCSGCYRTREQIAEEEKTHV